MDPDLSPGLGSGSEAESKSGSYIVVNMCAGHVYFKINLLTNLLVLQHDALKTRLTAPLSNNEFSSLGEGKQNFHLVLSRWAISALGKLL